MATSVPSPVAVFASAIRERDVSRHGIKFLPDSWARKIEDSHTLELADRFASGTITRGDLFKLGDEARDGRDGSARRLLLATMMWGYGTRGGRSYRNAKTALADETLDRRTDAVLEAIDRSDLEMAYNEFVGLRGYDVGFFTKFLYFAGHGAEWSERAKPLIFDSVVAERLRFLGSTLGADWLALAPRRLSPASRYLLFCETAQRWAVELSNADMMCTSDQIENFLFDPPSEFTFDLAPVLRALTAAALEDSADGTAGSATTKVLSSLPESLRVSFPS